MAQKVMLVDLKKLKKSSELVRKEAEAMISAAYESMRAQADFIAKAGVSPEDLDTLLDNYPSSEGVRQALEIWEAEFRNELALARSQMSKEIKLSGKLLETKRTRNKKTATKRCTRIF
ncbi:hypothetical protein [Endozoicomonas sp. Mp262]|uniref:hypothetical protein n=1 Tax=Endozoicomonas sp. Mp262 TaxID=2919499 RepID=UPI0021DFDA1D